MALRLRKTPRPKKIKIKIKVTIKNSINSLNISTEEINEIIHTDQNTKPETKNNQNFSPMETMDTSCKRAAGSQSSPSSNYILNANKRHQTKLIIRNLNKEFQAATGEGREGETTHEDGIANCLLCKVLTLPPLALTKYTYRVSIPIKG